MIDEAISILATARCSHIVYPHTEAGMIVRAATAFAGPGLRSGEAVVLINADLHAEAIENALIADGLDVGALRRSGRLIWAGAERLLETLLAGDMPEPALFETIIGELIDRAGNANGKRRVRVFNETVSMLWEKNLTAAIRMEELWQEVIKRRDVALLCMYDLTGPRAGALPQRLLDCHYHNLAAVSGAEEGLVPLHSILRTEELQGRYRTPDYETECCALTALADALADSPRTILQTLAQTILEVLRADSAGLSLLTEDEKRFYWPAIAGAWQPHLGGGTPRDFGPCGDVLDRKQPLLFSHWERRYPYLSRATPLAEEGLLVPFFVRGIAVGTIWAIAHDDRRKFDREDLRQLESLGRFASGAYEAWTCMEALEQQKVALQRSHDELADTLAELRTTNGDLEQFAYSASHDLIEPIRTIVTFSEILDRSYGEVLATEGRLYLSFLGASARRLEVLVKGLRLYTHSTLARVGEATVVEATAALDRALADLDAAIRKAGARVTHGVLPAVSVRETQLEQVLQNLIGNAIKYRKHDEPARIHVSAEAQGDQWLFSVRDNGIGIAPEYRWKIFGLFKRLHSGDAYEGAGLGLAICKKIVERNGGRIWMESEGPGHGSVFYFTLPMRESGGLVVSR